MKYMGWSRADLEGADPADIEAVIGLMHEEARELARLRGETESDEDDAMDSDI